MLQVLGCRAPGIFYSVGDPAYEHFSTGFRGQLSNLREPSCRVASHLHAQLPRNESLHKRLCWVKMAKDLPETFRFFGLAQGLYYKVLQLKVFRV